MFAQCVKSKMHWGIRLNNWLARLWLPLVYLGDKTSGKYSLVDKSDLHFFVRKNTTDKWILWEVLTNSIYNDSDFAINNNDTVVDVGAQIGIFSIFAAKKAVKGQVYSYEPFVDNFKVFKMNIRKNNLKNIFAYNLGVEDVIGIRKLYIDNNNSGGHSLYSDRSSAYVKIHTITLSDILKRVKHIDYLKVDAEGAEYDILLKSSKKTLSNIDKIVLEYHDYYGRDYRSLIKFLDKSGFSIQVEGSFFPRKILKMGIIKAKRLIIR